MLQEIDVFLTLLDKLVDVLKKKNKNKQQLFKEFIEPLFTELQLVVDDYFALFRKSRDLIRKSHKNKQELKKAIEEIRLARERLLSTRIKVITLATIAQEKINDKKVVDFCQKIVNFFFATQIHKSKQEKTSHASQLVELLDYVVEGKLDKEELLVYIDKTLKNLENSFVAIAQSYASLRIRFLL